MRGVLRFVAAVVVLVVLAVIFVHTRWGKELVRARVESALGDAVDGRVTLGSIDYGFLFDGIDLGGLTVLDREGKQAFAVGAVHVDLDRGSLFGGEPEIESLSVSGLAVAVVQRADGKTNLTGLAKASTNAPLAHVHVAALHVSGGATLTQADGTTIELTQLELGGSLDAHPAQDAADAQLSHLAAHVAITRPGGAPPTQLDLAVGELTLSRRSDVVKVDLHALALGALSVERVHGRVALAAGQLVGAQQLAITGARVDHAKLATELGRALLVDDVHIDAAVSGPINLMTIHGAVATRGTTFALDGTVDVSVPARPRYQLALVGTGASADVVPAGTAAVPPIETSIQLTLAGAGVTLADADVALALDIGPTKIGAIAVDRLAAKAHASHGAYAIESLTAHGLGFDVTATGDLAADATLHGRLAVSGNPIEAMAVLHAAGIEIPRRVPQLPHLELAVTAAGKLDGALAVTLEPTRLALAGGDVALAGSAKLEARVVREAATTIELHGLDVRALARLAGKPPPPVAGALSGRVTLARTPSTRRMDYDVTLALREPAVSVIASGHADGQQATARGKLVRTADGALLGTLDAQLPVDERGLVPARAWHVVLDLARRPFGELVALAPEPLRAQLLARGVPQGDAGLHVDLTGSPSQPRGSVDARATVTLPDVGPIQADLAATLAPTASGGGVVVDTRALFAPDGGEASAAMHGTVTLPPLFLGRAPIDPARLRAGTTLAESVLFTDHPLAALPHVPPALAALGGTVGGTLELHGSPANVDALALDGKLAWRGYKTATGDSGVTQLEVSGTPAKLHADIEYAGAVAITADVARTGERFAVHARIHANDTPLLPLLPALPALAAAPSAELGRMHADLDLTAAIARDAGGGVIVDDASLTGALVVHGAALELPGTARHWDRIALEVGGDPAGARFSVGAHESDAQVADRTLHASGVLALGKLRPRALDVALSTHQWLALGPRSPLLSDAPQASVDLDAHAHVQLDAPVIDVDATIDHLDLRAPDRHDRAHQPDVSSIAADVVYVDSLAQAGKLPVPVAPPAQQADPAKAKTPDMDIRVHVPSPIHALKAPLDVTARGELAVRVRDGVVTPSGQLVLTGGKLLLFGHAHELVDGHVAFDAAHPHGDLALTFARQLPDWSSRGLSRPERGVTIQLTGDPGKPTVTISGVENATLADVFAMNFAGRPVYVAPPGLPASATVEVPRGDQLNVLAYISLVIPHMLFLDRVAAWADPSEPRGAYGRIRDVELDRYGHLEKTRIRAVARPTQPGRSTAEVQWDRLWRHDAHVLVGAGLRAGDRLGGGLGVFFEWSSAQ